MLRVGYYDTAEPNEECPEYWEGCSLCTFPLSGPLIRLGSRKQTRWFHRDCLVEIVDGSFEAHPDDAILRWEERRAARQESLRRAQEIVDGYRDMIKERERERRQTA